MWFIIFFVLLFNWIIIKGTFFCRCGYDQEFSAQFPSPYVDGVLGLANGKSSLVSQLLGFGLTQNVIGHCFGGQGKGFLFFGDDFLPSGLFWAPKVPNSLWVMALVEVLFWFMLRRLCQMHYVLVRKLGNFVRGGSQNIRFTKVDYENQNPKETKLELLKVIF